MAFKMKGNPMKRNFGSPLKHEKLDKDGNPVKHTWEHIRQGGKDVLNLLFNPISRAKKVGEIYKQTEEKKNK